MSTGARSWPVAGYLVAVAAFAAAYAGREPYDDSHFFKRFALNALDHGSLAWNVDEGPVYGSTSQTWQLLAVLVAALTREHHMLAMRGLALLCLLGAFVVQWRQTAEHDRGASVCFAFCTPVLLFPLLSGMETALCILGVSGVLWACFTAGGRALHWTTAPLGVVFVYLTRPDAAVLVLPPLLMERWRSRQRLPARELALVGAGLALALLVLRLYYGTALPLPFYAKQAAFTPYDASFVELSNRIGLQRFALFALCAAPLFLRSLLALDAVNRVLVGSAVLFVAYHLAFTIDVMGMHGRFFAPAMPLLTLASARAGSTARPAWLLGAATALFVAAGAVVLATDSLLSSRAFRLDAVPSFFGLVVGVGGVLLLWLPRAPELGAQLGLGLQLVSTVGALRLVRPPELHAYSDDEFLALQGARSTTYRGLESLRACLGDELHVFHSEVGLPGLRFQRGNVTDLAGLLSPALLFRERGFDQACTEQRPEAVFLPHRNYEGLNREVLGSACLRGYARVVSDSSSPLYVRSDLLARFSSCARERGDPFLDATPP